MVGLERNKDPDLPLKEQSKTRVVILDDRKYGRSGYFYIYYDPETGDYVEPPEGFFDEELEDVNTISQFNTLYPNGFETNY